MPAGKAIYFRTVATDAFQGPNMANYMADKLKVKSIFVLDDSGAYGVGLADAFQGQAEKKGIKILGRDRLAGIAPRDDPDADARVSRLEPRGFTGSRSDEPVLARAVADTAHSPLADRAAAGLTDSGAQREAPAGRAVDDPLELHGSGTCV